MTDVCKRLLFSVTFVWGAERRRNEGRRRLEMQKCSFRPSPPSFGDGLNTRKKRGIEALKEERRAAAPKWGGGERSPEFFCPGGEREEGEEGASGISRILFPNCPDLFLGEKRRPPF